MSIKLEKLKQAAAYFNYLLKSSDEHGVHSPFLFSLLNESVYKKVFPAELKQIEILREKLKKDKRIISTNDLGAGSLIDAKSNSRSISFICRNFSKSPSSCKLLYSIVNHLKPQIMIELGTSLGISTMYQSAGAPNSWLHTIEGCFESAGIARENFKLLGSEKIQPHIGSFDDILPDLLKSLNKVDYVYVDGNHTYEATKRYFKMIKPYLQNQGVIVFDDINWSEGMRKAWKEIKEDQEVTMTVDFFDLGLVFINKAFSKENFILKKSKCWT